MELLDEDCAMTEKIWITWENQLRNRSMASLLGARLYTYVHRGSRLARYVVCTARTINTIRVEKPQVVFASNPSIVLACILIVARVFFRYRLVSDAHYGGVRACNGSKVFQRALDLCNRSADLVIVTNENHLRYIQKIGGHAIVCEDPLPAISHYRNEEKLDRRSVLCICSFDVDEPYRVILLCL